MKKLTPKQAMDTVLMLTGMNEEEYYSQVFEHGLAFTENYFSGNSMSISVVTGCEGYWRWFKNEWLIIENQFIENYEPVSSRYNKVMLKNYWLDRHDVTKMLGYPATKELTIEIYSKFKQLQRQQKKNGKLN